MSTQSINADWIFPISSPPIHQGSIYIQDDRIAEVLERPCIDADCNLPQSAILPGFVNSHTHLDLCGMQGVATPTNDFTTWLREVIAFRLSQSEDEIQQAIRMGIEQSIQAGVTLLCDISANGNSWNELSHSPIHSVVCYEVLGLTAERARASLNSFREWYRHTSQSNPSCRGVSPHAPYSVRQSLFEEVSRFASDEQIPVSIHLAETKEELQLLEQHSGPFRTFLEDLHVWDASGVIQSANEVIQLYQENNVLVAHGNYLTSDEINALSEKQTIVYCPRTHHAFGHPPHPIESLTQRGMQIALGTDSLASNPDLSILKEARFVREHYPTIPTESILAMITLWGASALGFEKELGTLEAGKLANLAVIPLENSHSQDPHSLVLDSTANPSRVMISGNWVCV